jgi:hypothetical protein
MLKEGYYFPEQRKEEQIIRFIHRRWVAFWPWIIFLGLMIMLPIILLGLWRNTITASFGPEDTRYFIVGLGAYYLITLAVFLTSWIGHYLNVVLITPERLIDIRQNGLFNRVVAEQSLLRVQDVSARMDGFFQTFFLYGTLIVETAGESPNFVIPDLPTPNEIANTILKLHEDLVKKSGFDEEDMSSGVGLESRPNLTKKQNKTKEHDIKKEIESEIDKLYSHPQGEVATPLSLSLNDSLDKKNTDKLKNKTDLSETKKEPFGIEKNVSDESEVKTIAKTEPGNISIQSKEKDSQEKNSDNIQEGDLREGVQVKL